MKTTISIYALAATILFLALVQITDTVVNVNISNRQMEQTEEFFRISPIGTDHSH